MPPRASRVVVLVVLLAAFVVPPATGADSASVSLSPLESVAESSRVAVARITGKLVGGSYTERWHAIAADGAEGNGSFSFMYMAPME